MPVLVPLARPPRSASHLLTLAVIVVALLIPRAAIRAMPEATIAPQRTWQPPSAAETFAGEIHYEFDTALNKTSARFVVPLGSRGIVHKIFFSTPVVHTLIVSYKYAGMRSSRSPDTVRLSFKSDEYAYSGVENSLPPAMEAYLTIDLGAQRRTYPLAIAQRTEVTHKSDPRNREGVYLRGTNPLGQSSPSMVEVHVARMATAWLSICDFLELTNETEFHGSVGGLAFSLDRQAVAGLREFAAQMAGAGAGPPEAGSAVMDCSAR